MKTLLLFIAFAILLPVSTLAQEFIDPNRLQMGEVYEINTELALLPKHPVLDFPFDILASLEEIVIVPGVPFDYETAKGKTVILDPNIPFAILVYHTDNSWGLWYRVSIRSMRDTDGWPLVRWISSKGLLRGTLTHRPDLQ